MDTRRRIRLAKRQTKLLTKLRRFAVLSRSKQAPYIFDVVTDRLKNREEYIKRLYESIQ